MNQLTVRSLFVDLMMLRQVGNQLGHIELLRKCAALNHTIPSDIIRCIFQYSLPKRAADILLQRAILVNDIDSIRCLVHDWRCKLDLRVFQLAFGVRNINIIQVLVSNIEENILDCVVWNLSYHGYFEFTLMIVEKNASIAYQAIEGAIWGKHTEFALSLCKTCLVTCPERLSDLLTISAENDSLIVLQYLIGLNIALDNSAQAVNIAADRGYFEIVQALVQSKMDWDRETALNLAKYGKHERIIAFLQMNK